MYLSRLLWVLSATLTICAQAPAARPEFRADRVIPSFGLVPSALAPGMLVSIYGDNLGPEQGCQGIADPRRLESPNPKRPRQSLGRLLIYPRELCGVRVVIAGKPAGLSYVQSKQINLNVAQDVPLEGSGEMRVIYKGDSSEPVPIKLGWRTVVITVDGPLYAGMPVWLRLHSSHDVENPIAYPSNMNWVPFPCQHLEVRVNGAALPKTQPKLRASPIRIGGNFCGIIGPSSKALRGRIPAHLEYRFDKPGTYEVRYTDTVVDIRGRQTVEEAVDGSEWTPIQVLPAGSTQRQEWLQKLAAASPTDREQLLYDFLASIFGYGEAQALHIAIEYLYHPDEQVRQYTLDALAAYYERVALVPALQDIVRRKGLNPEAERLLRLLTRAQ